MSDTNFHIAKGMPHIDEMRRERLEAFAPYVAILPWFNIDVLHKLYLNVFAPVHPKKKWTIYKIRAITCADFLQSPLTSRIDKNVYALLEEVRDALRITMLEQPEVQQNIGQFMLAYAQDCREHFLSPKYLEVFRVEGNLIVNPQHEATRITQHIVQQLNQVVDVKHKQETVAYYLNVLNRNQDAKGYEELLGFMDSYQKALKGEAATWSKVSAKEEQKGRAVSIRLPQSVKKRILKEITHRQKNRRFFALIIGIDTYVNEALYPLRSCARDAAMLRDFLKENINVAKVTFMINSQATRNQFIGAFRKICTKMSPEDTLLFYYAGYSGKMMTSDKEDSEGEEKIMLLHDSISKSRPITEAEIYQLITLMPSGSRLISILDTAFAQSHTRSKKEKTAPGQLSRSIAWKESFHPPDPSFIVNTKIEEIKSSGKIKIITFSASQKDEDAIEIESGGVFTTTLMRVLQNADAPFSHYEFRNRINQIMEAKYDQKAAVSTTYSRGGHEIFLAGFLKFDVQERIAKVRNGETTELDLSGLNLKEIPNEVFELSQLTKLNLRNNPLSVFHLKEIWPKLETLLLDNCLLTDVSLLLEPVILPALKQLSIRNNKITSIENWFTDPGNTIQLDFTGNPLPAEGLPTLEGSYQVFYEYFKNKKIQGRSKKVVIILISFRPEKEIQSLDFERNILDIQFIFSSNNDVEIYRKRQILSLEELGDLVRFQDHTCILHIEGLFQSALNLLEDEARFVGFTKSLRSYLNPENVPLIFFTDFINAKQIELLGMEGYSLIIGGKNPVEQGLSNYFIKRFYRNLVDGRTINDSFERANIETSLNTPIKTKGFSKEQSGNNYQLFSRQKDEPLLEWRLPLEKTSQGKESLSSGITWSNPKIYINDLDGQTTHRNELSPYTFPLPDLLTEDKSSATCWLNIFNGTIYFSAKEEPFHPWNRPIDLLNEDFLDIFHVHLLSLINSRRLKNTRNASNKTPKVLKIETRNINQKEWIEPGDALVFKRTELREQRKKNPSDIIQVMQQYDVRIQNISEQTIFVGLVALYSDMGISSMAFNNKVVELQPGEVRQLYDEKHTPYIQLNDYNIDYNWEEEFFTYKFFISNQSFNAEVYAQHPLWQKWLTFPNKKTELFELPDCIQVQSLDMVLKNPYVNLFQSRQIQSYLEKPIEAPIISHSHRQAIYNKIKERAPDKEYLNFLHQLDEKRWLRKFEIQVRRDSEKSRIMSIGVTAIINPGHEKDIIHHLQCEWPVLPFPGTHFTVEADYDLNKISSEVERYQIENILLFDLPDSLQATIRFIETGKSIGDLLNKFVNTSTLTYNKYESLVKNNGHVEFIIVGMDYLDRNLLVKNINIPYLPEIKHRVKNNKNEIRQYIDELNNSLIKLSQAYRNVHFIDLRHFTTPEEWKNAWTPGPELSHRLANRFLETLNELYSSDGGMEKFF